MGGTGQLALLIGQMPLSITEELRPDIRDFSTSGGDGLWGDGRMRYPVAVKLFASARDWQMLQPLRRRGGLPALPGDWWWTLDFFRCGAPHSL